MTIWVMNERSKSSRSEAAWVISRDCREVALGYLAILI
jgi:hypothetical protein